MNAEDMNEEMTEQEKALIVLIECLHDKSPLAFSEWCGCSLDDAIKIFSVALATAVAWANALDDDEEF